MSEQVVLSGIRATGRLHFGSLVGAVDNFVKYQKKSAVNCLYFVADFHTLTTQDDPEGLQGHIIEIIKDYLAAGLDPEQSVIYTQSSVPELAELMLYLGMLQPLGALQLIPTYKDLVRRNPDRVSHGLLSYPVLMAADILGPKATIVPVGSDQKPNVELVQKLAKLFNGRYGDTFVVPEMMEDMVKILGLDGKKMGKSDATNAIGIEMDRDTISKRYKERGITDPERIQKTDPGDPHNRCVSVYPVHEIITPGEVTRSIAKRCQEATIGCEECKELLTDSIMDRVRPFQDARKKYAEKDDFVREILHEGAKKARSRIIPTVNEVAEKMGIFRF